MSEEVLQEAYQRELYAENTLDEARDIHEKTKHMKAKLKLEEQEVYRMEVDADIKLEAAQLFRQRADATQEKLDKAKAKIRRLSKK